jgi:hypothetical protein
MAAYRTGGSSVGTTDEWFCPRSVVIEMDVRVQIGWFLGRRAGERGSS